MLQKSFTLFLNALNMKDTHETSLPTEESGMLEETKAPEVAPENAIGEVETAKTSEQASEKVVDKLTKNDVLEKLAIAVGEAAETTRGEVELLKKEFYKLQRAEVENLKKAFVEGGGNEKDFVAPEDASEDRLKDLLAVYKEKKAAAIAEEEKVKAENYEIKLRLIDELKALTESQGDFGKLYNDFKDIQAKWKEIKLIPQEHANELWKNYQTYCEKFYDIIKINNQFRDYDFKKNLEMKTALCETVEKLAEESDVISAFHQLQKLHQQWREIGPVARELRESLWARFKAASSVVNKRHQEHFDALKSKEQDNLSAKTAICEEMEGIDFEALKTFKDWEEKSKQVIALQEKWRAIGFTPRKFNVQIFERFRKACDVFFGKKNEFFKNFKGEMDKNLELKKALCEKAEALKDSTDWKSTTEKMIALQKEWKTIGTVTRRQSDAVWKRFISACDYFFEQKNKNSSSQKSEEWNNLEAKKALIEKINSIDETLEADEALAELKDLMAEWNTIGHVPFKEKDNIYKSYREAVDKHFDRLKVDQADRKMQTFRSNLSDMTSGEKGNGKLLSEREKLMRIYDRMKNELQTYENNIGFLSVSSKGGGGLVKEMERKIEKLKDDMALTVKKIEAIDETLE